MSKINISIEYAGLQLQVGKNEHGEDVTPLKPISDLFGIQWERQRKKVTESDYLKRFLGVCTLQMYCADSQKREQTCILLSRVAAFMMSINPNAVRGQGNHTSADFLEAKLTEWADALHDYEQVGVAINQNHYKFQEALRRQRFSFAKMIQIKNQTDDLADRKALSQVTKQIADELGISYQIDLLDEQQ